VKPWQSRAIDYALYVLLAVVAVKFVSRKLSGPSEGAAAASFELPLVNRPGEHFRLQDHAGKPVLMEVFASWCGACRRSAPALVESFRRHHGSGVEFVGVSVDSSSDDALRVKSDWSIPYDVALDDGRVSKSYGIEVLPTFVLIGKDGKVRHVSTGSASPADIDRWLGEL
jgi:cytochrome c biogenesis protein CcmG, thiol:disulfide interchange protein DsbE